MLNGLIDHRLDLSEDSSDWSSSKKKRRRQDSTGGESINDDDSLRRAGFFLVLASLTHKEYLLAVPQSLAKQVCDAARYKKLVKITKYSVSPVASSSSSSLSRGPLHKRLSVLELFSDGLEIQSNTESENCDDALTLTQFRALEVSFRNKKESGKPSSKDTFTITATVDAVSPIIAAVPSDPFALMELYEPADVTQSCVVVLKDAKALVVHAGIQPGDHITFRQVRRQKWNVPSWFATKGPPRLVSRAPTHVFVLTDPSSICWQDTIRSLPPMPSTVVPLVSLQGVVVSVETRSLGPNETHVIHCVRLHQGDVNESLSQKCQATDTLYVSHYPMSPELLMGIRPGAILRAVNVHNLHFHNPHVEGGQSNYGACLRSTITLVCCASEMIGGVNKDDSDIESDNPTLSREVRRQSIYANMSPHTMRSFAFGDVRMLYYRHEFREYLERCGIRSMLGSLDSRQSLSLDAMERIIIQHCQRTTPPRDKRPAEANNGLNKAKIRKRKRDQYAEFFDHACEEEEWGAICEFGEDDLSGCCLSRHVEELEFPTFVCLGDIHKSCIENLKGRLELLLSGSSDRDRGRADPTSFVQGGWTGTFSLGATELTEKCRKTKARDVEYRVAVGALVASLDEEGRPSSLADSEYQLPVSFSNLSGHQSSRQSSCVSSKVLVDFHAAIVSCLCLGTSASPCLNPAAKISSSFAVVDLPCSQSKPSVKERKGSCVLIESNGFLFIATIQVRCGFLSVVGSRSAASDAPLIQYSDDTLKSKTISIGDCLCGDRKPSGGKERSITGLLVRQRFRFVKLRNGSFMGCVLTLSHVPECAEDALASRLSTIQSIELKLSISFPKGQQGIFQKYMRKLLGDNVGSILREQSDLATAWWRISESGLTCPLVANGLDDFVSSNQQCSKFEADSYCAVVPVAVIPWSAMREGGHGYRRFQCSLDDVRASFLKVVDDDDESRLRHLLVSTESQPCFDAVGGLKFFPGSLGRRPRRRQLYSPIVNDNHDPTKRYSGELLAVPIDDDSGASSSTLADLHWKICDDMRDRSQSKLAPSMVRVIRSATLLSLSFCRALAECTKCFQPLKQKRSSTGGKDRPISGIVTSVKEDKKETYWHLPFPLTGNDDKSRTVSNHCREAIHVEHLFPETNLVCPNGCSLEHARIKWECSGLLDDGSGQAKLYAEREAALSLLGAGLKVHDIEAGAWRIESGILFQKSFPPKSFVKQAVLEAQLLARQEMNRRERRKRRNLEERDVIKFLTIEARAEYYMQQHCRQSSELMRSLDYYVRCKPLSKEAVHLNQSHVEMVIPPMKDYMQASTMAVTTYSLPPLKVSLVDCSVSKYEAAKSTDASWDLVRALNDTACGE